MNIATIDIGTNTVIGLDVKCGEAGVERVRDWMEIVRLGEGLDKTGRLGKKGMGRALGALGRIVEDLKGKQIAPVDRLAVVATEAVRKAENAEEFLGRAREILGVEVEVIDGEREARLSWIATSRSIPARGEKRTVLDIGGGSTELIVGPANADVAARAISMPIGSVRLTERILKSDVPTSEEKAELVRVIDGVLATSVELEGDLVGIAGTVTTICAIALEMDAYDAEIVHGRVIGKAEVSEVVEWLGTMNAEERRQVKGLDPKRADVIYAGGVILQRVMARAGVEELTVSDRGIRWGLAYEIAEREMGRRLS